VFIEEVFSTYLYTGTNANQTIVNGINLSGNGGLVWNKVRGATGNTSYHYWVDTVRGRASGIASNSTDAEYISGAGNDLSAFTSTGYTLGPKEDWNAANTSGASIVSWAFREQAKFFDIVTYTGTGVARTIAHNLGSVPGCIIVKAIDAVDDWAVYHRSAQATVPENYTYYLNSSSARQADSSWNGTQPTSSVFSVSGTGYKTNQSGVNYVAYLFAHNAGGFGLTATDNVVSCGGFTVSGGATTTVNLGYEPQWLFIKRSDSAGDWELFDSMRGFSVDFNDSAKLVANTTAAESPAGNVARVAVNSTGFRYNPNASADQMIYIAVRRGPMKTPTTGTSVFNPVLASSTPPAYRSSNFNSGMDLGVQFYTPGYPGYAQWSSRLTTTNVTTSTTTGGQSTVSTITWDYMNGYVNYTGLDGTHGSWMFKRAPGFLDVVCYTGTGTPTNFTHNLGVVPELMIVKRRDSDSIWAVYAAPLANAATNYFQLNNNDAVTTGNTILWNSTAPTSTVFTIGASSNINTIGSTNIAYLFATLAGVSKVGTYTGTGAAQTINCGFTTGARFVMIKRTNVAGDWYVWDSANGIIPSNDPYFLMNSDAQQVTGTDYVDTTNVGFDITSTAPVAINGGGSTYIFLAIA
jgi:hypothetical protein